MKSPYVIPLAIVLGGIIVATALYVAVPKRPIQGAGSPTLVRGIDSTDHILGNPAAKAIIVEYSDFDCQYCKVFDETMHQIIANEGAQGDVAWVFRHFPLLEIHPNALSHARAAECAAQVAGNDTFWKFETALFANQPVDPVKYGAIAKAAGVSGDAFATCYANAAGPSSTIEARILKDRQNALDIGAQGTPYSLLLVAGKPPVVLNGAYPYEAVKKLVDEALAN
ncbi:thioredoxin domain-containing protein [Candidatus Kaiserbacteria bacterium]|nr:thioredoxin domain-containing protein [Candidatus Kaiserbacteria bacterium]